MLLLESMIGEALTSLLYLLKILRGAEFGIKMPNLAADVVVES